MYKVAAVGDFESIAYFGAIGVETFFPASHEEADRLIKKLSENGYAIILVTEKYYGNIRFENESLPAVVPLPEKDISGNKRLDIFVKRAIGTDMMF